LIVFHDSTGKIIAAVAADSPDVMHTLTRIPEGTQPLYLDDTQYGDVWRNLGEYTIQSGVPVYTPIPDEIKLAHAKQAKNEELHAAFNNALNGGFVSSADGTERRYGFAPMDRENMSHVANVMALGIAQYPIPYADITGEVVNLDETQMKQLIMDAQAFNLAQVTKLRQLLAQLQAATTVEQVNAITW
jgi:hypothetical protein